MIHPLYALWETFRTECHNQFDVAGCENLLDVWGSSGARTKYYCSTLLPRVAQVMGLDWQAELFRVDLSFGKKQNDIYVPLILVESENVAVGADHEFKKLALLHAPLKVLMTCHEWGDHWGRKSEREQFLRQWSGILKAHHAVWPRIGLTGLMVAEYTVSDGTFRFYEYLFDEAGNLIEGSAEAGESFAVYPAKVIA